MINFSFLGRFDQKRIEEELEVVRRKASRLRAETEGSSIVEKLREELREYRDILKCSICLDRTKEVNKYLICDFIIVWALVLFLSWSKW